MRRHARPPTSFEFGWVQLLNARLHSKNGVPRVFSLDKKLPRRISTPLSNALEICYRCITSQIEEFLK